MRKPRQLAEIKYKTILKITKVRDKERQKE